MLLSLVLLTTQMSFFNLDMRHKPIGGEMYDGCDSRGLFVPGGLIWMSEIVCFYALVLAT